MRIFNFLIGILLSAGCFSQSVSPFLGTKTPYLPLSHQYTPPPAGYAPIFVDHVGRHGARYLTKAGVDVEVLDVMVKAEKANALTELGKKVRSAAESLREAGKGNYENITLLGKVEQEGIGRRMRNAYPAVFKGRGLEVMTTYKARTQQSADAFLNAFAAGYTGEKKFSRKPDSLDAILRFYDLSPGYLRYKKSAVLLRMLDSLEKDGRNRSVAAQLCSKLFLPVFAEKLMGDGEAGVKFAGSLYDLYAISFSMGGAAGFAGVFDQGDLEWLDLVSGAGDFLEKGPASDPMGIQVKVAAPLLADLIKSIDRVVGGDPLRPDAVLRFTHAEAIAPFAALMEIKGAAGPASSVFGYREQWRTASIIPLSANIQWVLYGGTGKQGFLVKVLLNEKEVVLPMPTSTWPYYRWDEVRRYYVAKLRGLGLGLEDDMLRYLAGLK